MGGWDELEAPALPPLELPLVLTLNVGFGIETVCDFAEFAIDWRLRIVEPVDLFLDRSSADLLIFFGCNSAARSL